MASLPLLSPTVVGNPVNLTCKRSLTLPRSSISLPKSNSQLQNSISLCNSNKHLIQAFPKLRVTNLALSSSVKATFTSSIPQQFSSSPNIVSSRVAAVAPLFFASLGHYTGRRLYTPLTIVTSIFARWLEMYTALLELRIFLTWFPQLPWRRQPLASISDLCDPYLKLYRNFIPPVLDVLDVNTLLAIAVLQHLAAFFNRIRA